MSRELDAAVASAHEMTKAPQAAKAQPKKPVQKAKPAVKVPEKVGAPTVKVDKSGGRVRLRLLDHALEGCISMRGKEIRYRLEPNKWTNVPEEVYIALRDKFYKPQEREVVDWNGDPNNPIKQTRMEVQNTEYVIEFPDEID
jgi:hypothetical protein